MKNTVTILYRTRAMKKYIRWTVTGTDSEINRKLAELLREGYIVNIEY